VPNVPSAQKLFWMQVLLGDDAQVDACFGLFGDSANLDVRLVHGFCKTYHRLQIILDTPDRTPR
jgi:hypothetical protein